jgi:hypothetical protein
MHPSFIVKHIKEKIIVVFPSDTSRAVSVGIINTDTRN